MNIQDLAREILSQQGVDKVSVGIQVCVKKSDGAKPLKKEEDEDDADMDDEDYKDSKDDTEYDDVEEEEEEEEDEVVEKRITRK